MNNFELLPFASADELVSRAASVWLDEIESAIRAGKMHSVAFSGGRTAEKFFAAAVELAKTRKIGDGGTPSLPANVHFFWADERCVPPNNPESNFKLANDVLFEPLKMSANQIHRIHGEDLPEAAAKVANEEIRRVLPISSPSPRRGEGGGEEANFTNPLTPTLSPLGRGEGEMSLPVLDLVFLGMGEDGHVASLFPGEIEAAVSDPAIYRAVRNSPKPPSKRISMSYAAIAAAKQVWVLVSGAGKEAAFRESLKPDGQTPLARVMRSRSRTTIFSDIPAG